MQCVGAAAAAVVRHAALLGCLLALAGLEVGKALPTFLSLRELNATDGSASNTPNTGDGLPAAPVYSNGPGNDAVPYHETKPSNMKDLPDPTKQSTKDELIVRASPDFAYSTTRPPTQPPTTTSTTTTTTIGVPKPEARRRRTEVRRRRTIVKQEKKEDYYWGGITTTYSPTLHPTPPPPIYRYTPEFAAASVATMDAAMAAQQAGGAALGYKAAAGSASPTDVAAFKTKAVAAASAKAAGSAVTSAAESLGSAAGAWSEAQAAEDKLDALGSRLGIAGIGHEDARYAIASRAAFPPSVPTKPPVSTSLMPVITTLPYVRPTTAAPYTELA